MNKTKDAKYSTRPQTKSKSHPYNVPLDVIPLRVIHPNKDEAKASKSTEPSYFSTPKDVPVVTKPSVKTNKSVHE